MALIVRGLYYLHFEKPLDSRFWVDVTTYHPDHETAMLESLRPAFPPESATFSASYGRESFSYEMAQSSKNHAFTIWQMAWHGGIAMHGENTPPQGVSKWWAVTRPTKESVAAEAVQANL